MAFGSVAPGTALKVCHGHRLWPRSWRAGQIPWIPRMFEDGLAPFVHGDSVFKYPWVQTGPEDEKWLICIRSLGDQVFGVCKANCTAFCAAFSTKTIGEGRKRSACACRRRTVGTHPVGSTSLIFVSHTAPGPLAGILSGTPRADNCDRGSRGSSSGWFHGVSSSSGQSHCGPVRQHRRFAQRKAAGIVDSDADRAKQFEPFDGHRFDRSGGHRYDVLLASLSRT